jgi:hypothetical protein
MLWTGRFKADLANFKVWKSGTLIFEPSTRAIRAFRDGYGAPLRDEIGELYSGGDLPWSVYRRLYEKAGGTAYK